MGSILNQWHALAKLRAEIEGKEGRVCWGIESLGTWPVTAGIENKRRKEDQLSRIDSKYWQAG